MAPVPYFINEVHHLFRGDQQLCDEKARLLNTCFAEFEEEPVCERIGNCFEFQNVDDECWLTKSIFTVFTEISPALMRGEGEDPKSFIPAKELYFARKPLQDVVEFAGHFKMTDEFKRFFESTCPVNELPTLYAKTVKNLHDKMKEGVASVDLSMEQLMWSRLFSKTELDRFGDPVWGETHPSGFADYKNLYTGKEWMLKRDDLTETKAQATKRIHNILMDMRKQYENMRNPITKKFMFCKENCVKVLVSPCVFEYLVEVLEIEEYPYTDGCCANNTICNSPNTRISRFIDDNGVQRTSPFFLKGRQFHFEVCEFFDQLSFEYLMESDVNNLFADILDMDLDNAFMMVFPDRIRTHKILQKRIEEIPGTYYHERDELARTTKFATYGRGNYYITEGTGMILHTGK